MAQEDDEGFLTSAFASPWTSVPWALGSGILGAMGPGGARLANGVNAGLQMGMGSEKYAADRNRRQKLSASVDKLSGATVPTKVTKIGMDPETTTYSLPKYEGRQVVQNPDGSWSHEKSMSIESDGKHMNIPTMFGGKSVDPNEAFDIMRKNNWIDPDTGKAVPSFNSQEEAVAAAQAKEAQQQGINPLKLSQSLAPLQPKPTYQATEERPMFNPREQEYLKTVGSVNPSAAITAIGSHIFKEQPAPHFDRNPDTGALTAYNPRTLESTVLQPGSQQTRMTFDQANNAIPAQLPPGTDVSAEFGVPGKNGKMGTITRKGGKPEDESKLPPPITEVQLTTMAAKVMRGGPKALNKRDLALMGTDSPDEAAQLAVDGFKQYQQLKQSGQVDMRTAVAQAMVGVKMHTPGGGSGFMNPQTMEFSDPNMSEADARNQGFTHKTTEKDREKLASLEAIDTSFVKLKMTTEEMKKGNMALMGMHGVPGTQMVSEDARRGEAYTSAQTIFTQQYDRLVGGMRAAASVPFQKISKENLTPKFSDSIPVIDFKLASTQIIVDAMKDEKRREVTGGAPNPKIAAQLDALNDRLKEVVAGKVAPPAIKPSQAAPAAPVAQRAPAAAQTTPEDRLKAKFGLK